MPEISNINSINENQFSHSRSLEFIETEIEDLRSTLAVAYYFKGVGFCSLFRFNEAFNSLQHAAEYKHDYLNSYNKKGNNALKFGAILQLLGRPDIALEFYELAINLLHNFLTNTYFYQGNALVSSDKYNEALQSYERAIELKPDHVECYFRKGLLLSDLNRHGEAL